MSGFIFITIFLFFTSKKYDNITFLTVICVVISYIITTLLKINNPNITINQLTGWSIFLAIITSLLSAVIVNSKWFNKQCMKINHKSINDDIWKDIIDYKIGNVLVMKSKDDRYTYTGTLLEHEEKGVDSWFILIDYIVDDSISNTRYSSINKNIKSTIAINLKDISRIEIFYDEKSEII